MPGVKAFQAFLHHFVLTSFATSSKRVDGLMHALTSAKLMYCFGNSGLDGSSPAVS